VEVELRTMNHTVELVLKHKKANRRKSEFLMLEALKSAPHLNDIQVPMTWYNKECAVDLVGPWVVKVRGNLNEFSALTVIDTVTNLVELVKKDDKMSDNVTRKYAQCWLAPYPWPQRCIHDPGGEFTGIKFQTLLEKCHIKDACTSAKKMQSNAMCERMHQAVGNILRTLLHGEPPQNIANAKYYVDEALSIAMHAMRVGIHSTMESSQEILFSVETCFSIFP